MEHVDVYRSILIVEEYGYYSPAIDRTVVERDINKIMEWIDTFWNDAYKPYKVDRTIIGEYTLRKKRENLNN